MIVVRHEGCPVLSRGDDKGMYSQYKPSSKSSMSFLEVEEHGNEILVESSSDLHLKSTVQILHCVQRSVSFVMNGVFRESLKPHEMLHLPVHLLSCNRSCSPLDIVLATRLVLQGDLRVMSPPTETTMFIDAFDSLSDIRFGTDYGNRYCMQSNSV